MLRKARTLGLVAAGLMLATTCPAFSLNPLTWLAKDSPATPAVVTAAAGVAVPAPAPVAPLPPGATPNYRAIVQQAGPAVVGITVAGSRRVGPDELPPDPDDPFFQFYRGLPGFQFRLPGPGRGGAIPFRGQGSGFIVSSEG